MLWVFAVLVAWYAAGCSTGAVPPQPIPPPPAQVPVPEVPHAGAERMTFHATAYSIEGRTASGVSTRKGIVAADPAVLPLGSRIRVSGAGPYNGEYVVEDTGRKIDGREIDIYLANDAEAKRFGNKHVTVEVLEYADRERSSK